MILQLACITVVLALANVMLCLIQLTLLRIARALERKVGRER